MWPYLSDILRSRGEKILPVYEMSAASSVHELPELRFTGTELTHAIIKADHLNYRNPLLPGLAFIIQSHGIIDWASRKLILKTGGSEVLKDFIRSSMTGRVGQGLAILFAQSQGYKFTAHLENYLVSSGVSVLTSNKKKRRIADFVFDKGTVGRAIVESKASFGKGAYQIAASWKGLQTELNGQVVPWMTLIYPPADKGFVVKSYIREPGQDESALVFVDPESDGVEGVIELSYETVRRSNYAAWLSAMGLRSAANRLRTNLREEAEQVRFLVVKSEGSRLAFPWPHKAPLDIEFIVDYYMMAGHNRPSSHLSFPFLGMDYNALIAISETIGGDSTKLMSYGAEGTTFRWSSDDAEYAVVSVFPDGTAFGDLGQVLMRTKRNSFEFVDVFL